MTSARFGQRARLTLSSAATAGLLLLGVFAIVAVGARRADEQAVLDELHRALRQASAEVKSNPRDPDLAEVAGADPALTLAAFSGKRLVARAGDLQLSATTPNGLEPLPTGVPRMAASTWVGAIHLVAAEPWAPHEASLGRLNFLLVVLWAPLTALAALAAWIAATSTFLPLQELARQAEQMSEASLSQRLEVVRQDEFGEFATRLNGFLDRIEDSVQRQQQFVADASHELRTPLSVLRGSIETTLQRTRSEAEYRQALDTALQEAENLSALVEVLLQSAKPFASATTAIDVEVAAERAHARWVDRFTAAEVHLELKTVSAKVFVPTPEIDALLDNLLSNALRVSPSKGACEVKVMTEDERCILAIEDEGPGVPKEIADRLFERFARGDAGRHRDDGGFGIGLAVCRRLVEIRGGSIHVETGAMGARFVVELPIATLPLAVTS